MSKLILRRLRAVALLAALATMVPLFVVPSPPAGAQQPTFTCTAAVDGDTTVVTFEGDRAYSENLLRDGEWVATTTGRDSYTTETGQLFVARLRGRGHTGPNGYRDVRCTSLNGGAYQCTRTADDVVRLSGDRALSENLLVDGLWAATVTGRDEVAVDAAATTVTVRLRGLGWTGPDGYVDIDCENEQVTELQYSCVLERGTVRMSGDRAYSENLLLDGTWHATVTGRDQIAVPADAGSATLRLRGLGWNGPNGYVDIDCTNEGGGRELAPLEPENGVLFGAYPAPNSSGLPTSQRATAAFEAATNSSMDIVQVFNPPHQNRFQVELANIYLAQDKIPFITWKIGPTTFPTQGDNVVNRVLAGEFDDQIRARAAEANQIEGPWFSRLFHEPDGSYGRAYDMTPENSRAYWQHIRDIFDAEGVTNAVWVWNAARLERDEFGFYPGDDLVDWIGADPYLWIGDTGTAGRCQNPNTTYQPMYTRLGSAFWEFADLHPDKPIMLGEWGAGWRAQDDLRPAFISSVADAIAIEPRMKAFVYFNSNPTGHCGWILQEGPAEGLRAYESLVNDPSFYVDVGALIDANS